MLNLRLLSLFWVIDDLEYVSTCLSAEKALSAVADVIGIVKYRRSNLWTAGKISLNTSLLSMASHIVGIEHLIAIHGITYCVYWTPHCYPWHHILCVLNTSLLSMTSHIVCIEHLIAIHGITYCVYWSDTSYVWWGLLDNFMKKWQLCVQFRHKSSLKHDSPIFFNSLWKSTLFAALISACSIDTTNGISLVWNWCWSSPDNRSQAS